MSGHQVAPQTDAQTPTQVLLRYILVLKRSHSPSPSSCVLVGRDSVAQSHDTPPWLGLPVGTKFAQRTAEKCSMSGPHSHRPLCTCMNTHVIHTIMQKHKHTYNPHTFLPSPLFSCIGMNTCAALMYACTQPHIYTHANTVSHIPVIPLTSSSCCRDVLSTGLTWVN